MADETTEVISFEWDEKKRHINIEKHRIDISARTARKNEQQLYYDRYPG